MKREQHLFGLSHAVLQMSMLVRHPFDMNVSLYEGGSGVSRVELRPVLYVAEVKHPERCRISLSECLIRSAGMQWTERSVDGGLGGVHLRGVGRRVLAVEGTGTRGICRDVPGKGSCERCRYA